MRPPPEIAQPADRFAHLDRMSKDEYNAMRAEAKDAAQSLEAKGYGEQSQERSNEQDMQHDYER
ncbi:MAG: hypothetical protein CL958_03085 [Euryarchaeota archaeon]|nr:hypothetical protein [Marinobacter sp.]